MDFRYYRFQMDFETEVSPAYGPFHMALTVLDMPLADHNSGPPLESFQRPAGDLEPGVVI